MPQTEVSPQKIYKAVEFGIERLRNFRMSRLMFIRAYTGQYYDRSHGTVGNEPLNMIFNALAIIVPNLVNNFPKNVVSSRFMQYRGYAELLEMGLDYLDKEIDIKTALRRWIVDSVFTMGIMKTGIATSKDLITFGENENVDVGQPYAQTIDFDDFVLDPQCRRLEEASFIGHRIRVARKMLLDSGLYNNAIVEALPPAGMDSRQQRDVEMISQHELTPSQIDDIQDLVDVIELWVPDANAIVTVPAYHASYNDFLRVDDYYGPDEGPYTFLSLTPPVPNNPLPVAPVGIWYDLHVAGNKMARKIMDQADRQKSVLGYKRSAVDDAQEVIDAGDGEAVAMDDPTAVGTFQFGGQEKSNESHLQQLSYWFSLMSGNTDQLGGLKTNAETATGEQILQANGSVRIEDMRDLVYAGTTIINRKLAWYLHSDPLISLPMVKRVPIPAQTVMTAMGPVQVAPPKMGEQQVILSPDVRQGEFLDFQFSIEAKSMSRMDPANRLQKMLLFASKAIPAAAAAAQVCAQQGITFSFSKFVIRMAKEMDIEWMDEVFYDPEFQQQMQELITRSPSIDQSKGIMSGPPMQPTHLAPMIGSPRQAAGLPAVMQNGGASNAGGALPGSNTEKNQFAQETAGVGQAAYRR